MGRVKESDKTTNRADWLFVRQGGRCFLGITPQCRDADRRMDPQQLGKGDAGRGWTWEHVIPRSLCIKLVGGNRATLKLLACSDCNHAKSANAPTMEHVDMALRLSREWFALTADVTRGGRIGAEIVADLEVLVHAYRTGTRDRSVEPSTDPEVPNSVEEALMQGGFKVAPAKKKKPKQSRQALAAQQRKAERAEGRAAVAKMYEPMTARVKREASGVPFVLNERGVRVSPPETIAAADIGSLKAKREATERAHQAAQKKFAQVWGRR